MIKLKEIAHKPVSGGQGLEVLKPLTFNQHTIIHSRSALCIIVD